MSLKAQLKQAHRLEQAAKDGGNHNQNSLSISVPRTAVKPRNYLALDPLLQKGGIHESEDVKLVRKKRRRETKQMLRKTDWLSEI